MSAVGSFGLRADRGLLRTVPRINGRTRLVKSIQRVTLSWASAATFAQAITAVDLNNAVIRLLGWTNSGTDQGDLVPRVELTNATTITAYRYNTGVNATTVSVEVIEYYPGVIKSIQRGSITHSAAPTNTAIAAVSDLSRATLDELGFRVNVAGAIQTYVEPYIALTSTSNIQSVSGSTSNQQIGYQVVEWW